MVALINRYPIVESDLVWSKIIPTPKAGIRKSNRTGLESAYLDPTCWNNLLAVGR
jgi:hypothetical protein